MYISAELPGMFVGHFNAQSFLSIFSRNDIIGFEWIRDILNFKVNRGLKVYFISFLTLNTD